MSIDETARLKLGVLADSQQMNPAELNGALQMLDALVDCYLLDQYVNTPPASPSDGDAYLLGGAPGGVWNDRAYKIAYCVDGGWQYAEPFNGLRAFVAATGAFIVYRDGAWTDWNSLISAHEVSLASAATCDLGAAGSLFVAVTGTTAITGLGSGANLLRFVRFSQSLTLTHNASSLILPGGANIVTAAGDSALFASDGSGNWRCRFYQRASGIPPVFSGITGSGAAVGSTSPSLTTPSLGAASASSLAVGGAAALFGSLRASFTPVSPSAYWDSATLDLQDGRGFAAGVGAGIVLEGNYSSTAGHVAAFAGLQARKANGTDGDATGSLDIWARSGNIRFLNGGTIDAGEMARFGSDSSFLVGTTANGGWSGYAKAETQHAGNGYALSGYGTSSTSKAMLLRIDNTASAFLHLFYGSSTNVGSITTNGSSTSFNTTSSFALKMAAAPLDAKDAIAGANMMRGRWIGQPDVEWVGGYADEMAALVPEGYKPSTTPGLAPHQQGYDPDGFDYTKWVPYLIAELQRLQGAVAALENRLAAAGIA